MYKIYLLLIFSVLLFLRLYKLGEIPEGASLLEVKLGVLVTEIARLNLNNLFIIRLPFALMGIISALLFYGILLKATENKNVSLISVFIVAVSPWHIMESRVFSWGVVISSIILLGLFTFFNFFSKNYQKAIGFFLVTGFTFLVLSVFSIPSIVRQEVEIQRNIADEILPQIALEFFSNKLIENYRHKESVFFENFDFGMYFFGGYPRQRWGVEETPKLFAIFLPLILYGIYKIQRPWRDNLMVLFLGYVLFLAAQGLRDSTWGLPLLFIFAVFTAHALSDLLQKNRKHLSKIGALSMIVFLFEFLYFLQSYKEGLYENQFSPRRKVYNELAHVLKETNISKIYLTKRLDNPYVFLRFYEHSIFEKLEMKEFDIVERYQQSLFVGVLPYEASPSELLFKENGIYKENIAIKAEIPDDQKNQYIIVFTRK